jgi:DNA topoisomerase-1
MKLMIIESPGKVQKLTSILGADYKIVASIGHVRDLPTDDIAVSAPDFRPTYVLSERGQSVMERIKRLVSSADEILLATDPDREGESISWHLKEVLGLKEPKRVTFNAITPDAVRAAIATPRVIDVRLVAAQEARRVLDRLVGYMVSPEISRRHGSRLSAGRVQSLAVRIIVDRERAIRGFRKISHFGVELKFETSGKPWSAKWLLKPGFVTEENPYFLDRSYAQSVAGCRSVRVQSCQSSDTRRAPHPPFMTSTMQQAASVQLDMNPEVSMAAAQALYEQGHITYHRTDNPNITDDDFPPIRIEAEKLGLAVIERRRQWPAKDGAQAGHPAVTPTHWDVPAAGESEPQRALYTLIRTRAIASQLQDARYDVRVALLSGSSPDGRALQFEARGRTLVEPGWISLVAEEDSDEEEEEPADSVNLVPELSIGQELQVLGGKVTTSETKPPKRYTQASLIKKMEAEGIGRPSTYATIMSTIMNREYAKIREKVLVPTERGEAVVDMMAGRFSFMELDFTRRVETELDLIASGRQLYRPAVAAFHDQLEQELSNLASAVPIRPSEKMVLAVRSKAKREGVSLPDEMLESADACKAFLGPRSTDVGGNRVAPASDKQIALLQRFIGEGKITPPAGYPDEMSGADASKIIEKLFAEARRSKRSRGKRDG